MKDIKQELQNLFTGEIYDKETNNLEDIQIDKMSIDILKNDNDKFNMNTFNNTNQEESKMLLKVKIFYLVNLMKKIIIILNNTCISRGNIIKLINLLIFHLKPNPQKYLFICLNNNLK